jgi:hypothetical protein
MHLAKSLLRFGLLLIFVSAVNAQSKSVVMTQYSRKELHQMMSSAHTNEQYQTLATYFRSQERLFRQKAQAQQQEYEEASRLVHGAFKFPTRADVARQANEQYTYQASRMAKLAEAYEQRISPAPTQHPAAAHPNQ